VRLHLAEQEQNIQLLLNSRIPNWHRIRQHTGNTLQNLDILLSHEVPH
jgi:hypothetical protein